jgi:hypothetical protein
MEGISDRIAHLTQELRELHTQLQWPNFQNANSQEQDLILNELLNAGLGHDLKKAVDLLSQFLWYYIESAAARTNAEEVDYAQQGARLGQAAELLRLLHHSPCPLMNSLAFVEHATMTVSRQMESSAQRNVLAMEKSA